MTPRQASVAVLLQVVQNGRSLTDSLNQQLPKLKAEDRALCQALSYGCLRFYPKLDFLARQLVDKPLRNKDQDIHYLILIGLYQLLEMRIPDHAAVSQTVAVCKSLRKQWAKNLVNGVLRNFLRQKTQLIERLTPENERETYYNHPGWLLEKLQQAWPDDWEAITTANNQQAPMSLRVHQGKLSREAYLEKLVTQSLPATALHQTLHGIQLKQAIPTEALPGFVQGEVSVQDGAAQLAAELLKPQAGERILDACAAPGGKTAHLLETQAGLEELVAVDIEAERLERITENLTRLGLSATLVCADASEPASWWDGRPFDRILLDAPCSATGVIRRHPDIKLLRRASDISTLQALQHKLLRQVWPLLKQGGMLLYATCSVLPEENHEQVSRFLSEQTDANLVPIEADWGRPMSAGRQILPGEQDMDGFFYALICKSD
ncbi:MAG: 16S rRNA (cytosine(967)-C(5))-methyltransferase RsmB [Gammaproteobacteria bacterium]|nr:16S rRNA (cytosine(967)-C(5))-methyltransferase RsmB [Gammaproteobacteria bacterium]